MGKPLNFKVYKTLEEMDKGTREHYASLSPEELFDVVIADMKLRRELLGPNPDWPKDKFILKK